MWVFVRVLLQLSLKLLHFLKVALLSGSHCTTKNTAPLPQHSSNRTRPSPHPIYSHCLANTRLLPCLAGTWEMGVAHMDTPSAAVSIACCGGTATWGGGMGRACAASFLVPAPNERLRLNPDPFIFMGEEGAELGPQELDLT